MVTNSNFKTCKIVNFDGNIRAIESILEQVDSRSKTKYYICKDIISGEKFISLELNSIHNIDHYMDADEICKWMCKELTDIEKLGIIARAIKQEKLNYNNRYNKIKYIMKRLEGFDSIDEPLYVEICCINDKYYPLIFVGSKSHLLEDDRRGLRAITFSYMNALNPTKEYSFKEPVNYITILEFDKNKLGLIEYNSKIITDQEFESIINEVITRKTKSLSLYKNN